MRGARESRVCARWEPEARDPPGRLAREYLAAVELPQLLHDPLLQHQALPQLLTVVFHRHFALLVPPLLLHLPGRGGRGPRRRRALPGGALEKDPTAAAASPAGRLTAARRHRHGPAGGTGTAEAPRR